MLHFAIHTQCSVNSIELSREKNEEDNQSSELSENVYNTFDPIGYTLTR